MPVGDPWIDVIQARAIGSLAEPRKQTALAETMTSPPLPSPPDADCRLAGDPIIRGSQRSHGGRGNLGSCRDEVLSGHYLLVWSCRVSRWPPMFQKKRWHHGAKSSKFGIVNHHRHTARAAGQGLPILHWNVPTPSSQCSQECPPKAEWLYNLNYRLVFQSVRTKKIRSNLMPPLYMCV